jgi:hypothetical protein
MTYPNTVLSQLAVTCRNHSTKPISSADLKYLQDVALHTPSKQSQAYFEVIFSSDLLWNQTHLYPCTEVPEVNEEDRKYLQSRDRIDPYHYGMNSQVIAPLVMIFNPIAQHTQNKDYAVYNSAEEWRHDALVAMGIAMGVTAYQANVLGYLTGFCSCIRPDRLKEAIEQRLQREFVPGVNCTVLSVGHNDLQAVRKHPLKDDVTYSPHTKHDIPHCWIHPENRPSKILTPPSVDLG